MDDTDLLLPANPSIQDFQAYIAKMMQVRGFDKNSIVEEMLLLTEEVGELAKVVRKAHGMHLDENSVQSTAGDELADVLSYVLSIANYLNVDLEAAFRIKDEKNKKRVWQKPADQQ